MKLLGFDITRKAAGNSVGGLLAPADGAYSRGWINVIREAFTGAWQRNIELRPESVLSYTAVFACYTLIQSDVAKLRFMLLKETGQDSGIYAETTSPSFSPVLNKPNDYQTHIDFKEAWIGSKLRTGNAYILLQRNNRRNVTRMYVLDPFRVRPMVTPDGSIYYELAADNLSGIQESILVPASEIIHDRMNCIFHPLVGIPPLFACALPATVGLEIQRNSGKFFANGAKISGTITVPGAISDENAKKLSDQFNEGYQSDNAGRIAVLGDGLKFTPLTMTSTDAQLIDQLNFSNLQVCSAFHVPPYKVSVGTMPSYDNIEALGQEYYSTCLQIYIEKMETLLVEALDCAPYDICLDIDQLLRMDTAAQYKTYGEGVGSSLLAPNEGRKKLGLPPVKGGESPMAQQQNFSLAALAKRDALPDPFVKDTLTANPPPAMEDNSQADAAAAADDAASKSMVDFASLVSKTFSEALA